MKFSKEILLKKKLFKLITDFIFQIIQLFYFQIVILKFNNISNFLI